MATFTMPPFTGGPEDDVFRPTEERDSIRGGGGTDTVDYSAADEGVEVNLIAGRGTFGLAHNDSYSSIENAIGSVFNDRLIGRSGVNTLTGGEGDDNLYGSSGDDTLMGGDGDDTLGRIEDGPDQDSAPDFTDDAGDDTMMGNAGFDMLYGGPGNDRLMGGRDDDMVRGNVGNDMLWGGAGNDMIYGGAGNDQAWGGAGDDTIMGGGDTDADGDDTDTNGADRLWGNAGADILMGGAGDDLLGGGRDGDTVLGGAGEDTLWGGAGDDTIYGGAGADTIEGGAGADRLYGGTRTQTGEHVADRPEDNSLPRTVDTGMPPDGVADVPNPDRNTVSYAGSNAAVTIDLGKDADDDTPGTQHTASGGHAAGDVLEDFQSIRGSAHGDRLTGDDGANRIQGHGGDDVIRGGDNPATFQYSYPDGDVNVDVMDVLWGGAGDDDIDGQGGPDSIIGGSGDDMLAGGDGADTLQGSAGDDVLMGGTGDDTLEGGPGTDTIDGGVGNDTLSFANAAAGVTVDLTVEADDDGYRTLAGDRVKDVETVMGSPFDDVFIGSGDDVLAGGLGDDTYVINPTSGGDIGDPIMENEDEGVDTIRFTGVDANGAARGVGVSSSDLESLPDHVENVVAEGNVRDFIRANDEDNEISTGRNNDLVSARDGDDVIHLGSGDDVAYGGDGDDVLNGDEGDDRLFGRDDDDVLDGGAGDDRLNGENGADVLDGGAGRDRLNFSVGDTVTGGPDKDEFHFEVYDETASVLAPVTITDFSTREQIDVGNIGITGAEMRAALDNAVQDGDDVRITFPASATFFYTTDVVLVLEGVDLGRLTHATSGTDAEFITI